MNKVTVTIIAVVIAIVGLGIITSLFGNVGIRRIQGGNGVTLSISQPVIPGVPVMTRWEVAEDTPSQQVSLVLRTESGNESLGVVDIGEKSALIVIPCADSYDTASLNMVGSITGVLLDSLPLEIIPAGPDCF